MIDKSKIKDKLDKVEELIQGAKTQGEFKAAVQARKRILEKYKDVLSIAVPPRQCNITGCVTQDDINNAYKRFYEFSTCFKPSSIHYGLYNFSCFGVVDAADIISKAIDETVYMPKGRYDIRSLPENEFVKNLVFPDGCVFASFSRFNYPSQFGNSCMFDMRCSFAKHSTFGEKCVFFNYCMFDSECTFGELCMFHYGCEIGDKSVFMKGCLFDSVAFGDRVTFAPLCGLCGQCQLQHNFQLDKTCFLGNGCSFK